MKTLMNWGYSLAFALVFCISCSDADNEIATSLAPFEADRNKFDEFFSVYQRFLDNLPVSESQKFTKFIDAMPELPERSSNARGVLEVVCRCIASFNSCSANGKLGECCVCWNPKTHVGVCGVYGGIGACRTEKIEGTTPKEPAPAPKVTIYPERLSAVLDFIEQNNIGHSSSQSIEDFQRIKTLSSQL